MKKRLFILLFLIVFLIGGFVLYSRSQIKEYKETFKCLDQICEITIYSKTDKKKELKKMILYYQTLEDSFVSEVNKVNKQQGSVSVSQEVLRMVDQFNHVQLFMNNATLTNLWKNSLKDNNVPALEDLKQTSSYRNDIKVNKDSLYSKVYDINIDGYYFGYISDCLQNYLKHKKTTSYLFNLAGNITVGKHYRDEFHTAIINPISENVETIIKENNVSIYTVGNHPVAVDGTTYVPVIDPNTKYPYTYHKSVTVVASDSILASILSYKLYTMNMEDGKNFIKNYPVQQVLWIGNDGKVEMFEK